MVYWGGAPLLFLTAFILSGPEEGRAGTFDVSGERPIHSVTQFLILYFGL